MGLGFLRFVLALSVICTHGGGLLGYDMATGRGAVEGFFMLSGFLMQLVLSERYDPKKDLVLFYTNRALRIYPTYFLALLFALAIAGLLSSYSAGFFFDLNAVSSAITPLEWLKIILTHLFIFGQDTFVFQHIDATSLLYTANGVGNASDTLLVIPPAWSISLELMFYLLAPFLARLSTSWLVAIMLGSFALRCISWSTGLDYDPWTYRFFPFEVLLFVGGMVSYRCREAIIAAINPQRIRPVPLIALFATLMVHPALLVAMRLNIPEEAVYMGFYALLFLVLPGLFECSRGSKLDNWLGSFSFPVYLLHWPIIMAYNVFFGLQNGIYHGTERTVICAVLTLIVSYGVVVLVENPLDRIRKLRHTRRVNHDAAIPAAMHIVSELVPYQLDGPPQLPRTQRSQS